MRNRPKTNPINEATQLLHESPPVGTNSLNGVRWVVGFRLKAVLQTMTSVQQRDETGVVVKGALGSVCWLSWLGHAMAQKQQETGK